MTTREKCKICAQKDCFLFRYCSPEWHGKLIERKECIRYSAHQQLIHEGSPVHGVYFIQSGKIKVYKEALRDKSQVVRLAKSGDILGYEVFGGEAQYPVSAITLAESLVCFIPSGLYLSLLKYNSELSIRVMFHYAEELRRTETRLRNMALMTVREKVADALLTISDTFGVSDDGALDVAITRKDIAEIAGTNSEQVSRYISEFKSEGILDTDGKKIMLLNPDGLKKLLKDFVSY